MQRKLLLLLLLAFMLCPVGHADDVATLLDRLHKAQVSTSLDSPGLTPWHLKVATTLLDPKGRPTEEGSIEEWWIAPDHWKVVFKTPTFNLTEVKTSKDYYRTAEAGAPPLLLGLLLEQIVHPMPSSADIDQSKPDLRKENFGKIPLGCIMLDQPIKTVPYPPLGLFPTYCFEPGKESLRDSFDFGSQNIVRNKTGLFQGRHVSIETAVSVDNVLVATAHIDTLSGLPASTPDFDTAELKPLSERPVRVAGGVIQGAILRKVPPVYPEEAKQKHISGTVILHAIIGRDGHVRSLRFVSLPDPSLGIAAVSAVRQWTYKPYLLNGEPTEVDTTVTVNFAFGPG